MKAVVMAGGEGTRLRPLTYNLPKPMVPVANRALMEHVLGLLRAHGFTDIVVTVGFQANAVQTYFGKGSEFGARVTYCNEETPLGTAGSVRNALRPVRDTLDDAFLVISGDVLTDIDLGALVGFHQERKALATMALYSSPDPLDFGVVMTHPDGSIGRFLEKPSWGQVFSDTINTGIYVLEPDILDFIPDGAVDFASEVFPRLLAEERPLFGCVTPGYWEDVGTLEAYSRAHRDIMDRKVSVDIPGWSLRPDVWLGEGAELAPGAQVRGPAIVGDYSRVSDGAVLGEYTVLGRNVSVGTDAVLERVVVHDNVYVGPGARLRGCTVGRGSDLRRGARLEEGVVVGDQCFVGEHAVIRPGVKVFPFKTVEHGAVVNSSIVWGSRGARHLFGRNGVSGLANVDISPELTVRLAMAFASTMRRGSLVVVSRDSSRAGRALAQSVSVGLNAAGVDVADLDVATVPLTRFAVRNQGAAGGISVRSSPEDPGSVSLEFFDRDGIDLPDEEQRKVERIFYREDFRRCLAPELGELIYPVRVTEVYAQVLLGQVGAGPGRRGRLKLVLDYASGAASLVVPSVLGPLGTEVLAVNPYATSPQPAAFDRWEHARAVAAVVTAAGAHLGAVLDPGGERLTLVDDGGHILTDDEATAVLLAMVAPASGPRAAADPGATWPSTGSKADGLAGASWPPTAGTGPLSVGAGLPACPRPAVVLPVTAPSTLERMCAQAGAEVRWAKLSSSHLMQMAALPGAVFAAGPEGGYVFPPFLPAYDGVAALAHLCALLAGRGQRLSDLVAAAPRPCCAHEGVVTPWERKGQVMRAVMDLGKDMPTVLVDGVKVVHDDGWCLVVPDPEEPLTHIWAEAASDDAARARAQDYARQVRNVLRPGPAASG
jgi:mannose-1-phosphate guanylyltransferase / phosphomannomutase